MTPKDKEPLDIPTARIVIRGVRHAFQLGFHDLRRIQKYIREPKLEVNQAKIAAAFDNFMEELQKRHPHTNQFRSLQPPLIYAGITPETRARDLLIFDSSLLRDYPNGDIPLAHGEGLRIRDKQLLIWAKTPNQPFPMGFEIRDNRLPSNLPDHGKAVALWAIHYLGVKL